MRRLRAEFAVLREGQDGVRAKEAASHRLSAVGGTGEGFDGAIDFDKRVTDPAQPARMLAVYDSGDHLHLNDAGHKAMGKAVDLGLFGDSRMMYSAEKRANIASFHKETKSPREDGSASNAPLLLVIEPTTRCNFKCVHCPRALSAKPPADMSLELFQRLVPALRTALDLYLFGDGEALLDIPRHLAMISRVYQENPACTLGFSTNGKLLTPEAYELYSAAGIHYIQLSVDAAAKELYETMRRGGSFDELAGNLEGIAALRRRSRARQPQLRLATVISKQNYRQLPGLAEFARRYEFSTWYINAEYPHNPGRDALRLTTEDLAELERFKGRIARNYGSCYSTFFDPCMGLSRGAGETWLEAKSSVFCTVPWQRFELKANGDVKICPYHAQPICSMNGKSFREVWNGAEFRRIRKAFASGTGIPAGCIHCKLGMRWQYLPGYPGIPRSRRARLLARMKRAWG
jgi:MoaA/NifB/PqqE/SkfB family radical SAM enzyme